MQNLSVAELLKADHILQEIQIKGWVKTFRSNRFIALNDGSTIKNIQCVLDFEKTPEDVLKLISTGAAIEVKGVLVESQGKVKLLKFRSSEIIILGSSNPEEYPIQPKKHSMEFLRENAHLRIRTNTFSAVMRVRSVLSFAIHQYFINNGFYYFHAPIITGSDAEGAGEMFSVSTLDKKNPPLTEDGEIDFKKIFSEKKPTLLFLDSWKLKPMPWHWERYILSDLLSGLKIRILQDTLQNSGW